MSTPTGSNRVTLPGCLNIKEVALKNETAANICGLLLGVTIFSIGAALFGWLIDLVPSMLGTPAPIGITLGIFVAEMALGAFIAGLYLRKLT